MFTYQQSHQETRGKCCHEETFFVSFFYPSLWASVHLSIPVWDFITSRVTNYDTNWAQMSNRITWNSDGILKSKKVKCQQWHLNVLQKHLWPSTRCCNSGSRRRWPVDGRQYFSLAFTFIVHFSPKREQKETVRYASFFFLCLTNDQNQNQQCWCMFQFFQSFTKSQLLVVVSIKQIGRNINNSCLGLFSATD